jgi:hypothetical protein
MGYYMEKREGAVRKEAQSHAARDGNSTPIHILDNDSSSKRGNWLLEFGEEAETKYLVR